MMTVHFAAEDVALKAVDDLRNTFPEPIKYMIINIERAPSTGAIHWQAYLELSRTMRIPGCKALHELFETAHLEARRGTQERAIEYCSKEESRVGGPFTFGEPARQGKKKDPGFADVVKYLHENPDTSMSDLETMFPVPVARDYAKIQALKSRLTMKIPSDKDFVPRPWQRRVLDMLNLPADDRHIIWVTDTAGNKGKTRLARHLMSEYSAVTLTGRIQDMMHTFKNQISPVAIFDISRSAAEHSDHLYTMAELLKNGQFNSCKYDSSIIMFPSPHVIFFSNSSWDRSKWSHDRVIEIDLSAPEPSQNADQALEALFNTIQDMPLESFW